MSRRLFVDNDNPNRDGDAFVADVGNIPTESFDDTIEPTNGSFCTEFEGLAEVESSTLPLIAPGEPNGVGAVFDIGGNTEGVVMIPL